MREIKFRAWDKKTNTIRSVEAIKYANTYKSGMRIRDEDILEAFCSEVDHDLSSFEAPLTRFEIMQFTGVKDKEDKEIYEGDIIASMKCPEGHWVCGHKKVPSELFRDMVVFENGSFIAPELEGKLNDYFVIGNIYENPELLEPNN